MADDLDGMRRNPAGDWRIIDIGTIYRKCGVRFTPPTGGGSHFKVSHPSRPDILTIPYARSVKAVYIRKFVRFIDALEAKDG